ncbi:hypothetical protein K457DRAFT_25951 [Linnemannia elongata AG-77]|uniref:Uncharacterized protein n=1 Tax=Linnemannia elongata AG-77 TaxID=1314771 RepID=A0A197JC05_9FUNG|nr:hypothetical protein K457DRAFT_25951 [Linnemannia elongata AG-77]
MSKVFLSFQEDVVAAALMKKVVLPKNIPDYMLRALEVSRSNQSNDMHILRKSLTAVNDKLAHQSNQSLWANNILDALAKSFLAQKQQLRIQRETIESMQQAIDAMARQLRLQGSVAPGNPGNLSYLRQSGIPGPGYLGYTGISTPGFLPHLGPFPGNQSPMPKQKQSKLVQNRALVAIQPSHSGSTPQDSSIVLPTRPSSELERLLSTRPQGMPVLESHQPESASGSGSLTEAGISASVQRPSAPPRETWFTWTTHHSSTKSIFEEYQRCKSELATRLEPGDGGMHRLKQKRRQSDATEKHVSDIRIISTEVDILKDKLE